MQNKKPTVAQIADTCGVSPATVSRVLHHPELVSPDTVALVRQTMHTLGYTLPQNAAPLTKDRTSGLIVISIPWFDNSFYSDIIRGAKVAAEANGFDVLIYWSPINNSTIDHFRATLKRSNASGVISMCPLSLELLRLIEDTVPLVQCCEYNSDLGLPYVSVDDYHAAQTATEHLISCGRNKLAFICGPQNYKYSRERKAGFLEVLQRYHLSVPQNWVVQMPDNNYDLAYSALCHLLSSPEIPNGIFACSDVYATAVIRAARRYALQVPADIMVVGFDNVDLAVMTTPSLTTISQPRYQMGYTACNLLLERLNDANAEVKSMLLETELIVRESTTAMVP